MVLGTSKLLPTLGDRQFLGVGASKFVISACLNPCFLSAMHACYGYSKKAIVVELSRTDT